MEWASFLIGRELHFGYVRDRSSVVPTTRIDPRVSCLRDGLALGALDSIVATAEQRGEPAVSLGDVKLLPPLHDPDTKFLCAGVNFRSHRAESEGLMHESDAPATYPSLFSRFADSHVGHNSPIVLPPEGTAADYEGELAVILGRPAYRVRAAHALDYVAGYSCYNDLTLRDWQHRTSQWTAGKNFHAFGSFGPFLKTVDDCPHHSSLTLETRVNGALRQQAGLSDMIHSIADLIAYASTFTPLSPGDVVTTGTPEGVGMFLTPPEYLKDGDVVEVTIAGVGTLRNELHAWAPEDATPSGSLRGGSLLGSASADRARP